MDVVHLLCKLRSTLVLNLHKVGFGPFVWMSSMIDEEGGGISGGLATIIVRELSSG